MVDITMNATIEQAKVEMGRIIVPFGVLTNEELHQLGYQLEELMGSIITSHELVDTGRLRDSFYFQIRNDQREQSIKLLSDVEYLPYVLGVEFGSFSGDDITDPHGIIREYLNAGNELVQQALTQASNSNTAEHVISVNDSAKVLKAYKSYTGGQ